MALPASPLEKPRRQRVIYPVSDGQPMAESDTHRNETTRMIDGLKVHFADRPRVYVSGNNFIYWEKGNPRKFVSPDVYVVFGVLMKERDIYQAWKEGGRLPSFVLEITSKSTQKEDLGRKYRLYERTLRVPEYVLFDPTRDYLNPPLQGFRLEYGVYVPIPWEGDRIYSEQLKLYFVVVNGALRLYDPAKEQFIPTLEEAEAEIKRLRAEIARLKQQSGHE